MGLAAAGAIAGIAGGVAGVANAAGNLIGGNKAAGGSAQSQYLQALEMNQNIANTAPFIGAGQSAANALTGGLQGGRFGTPMDLSGMPTSADVPQYTGGPPPQFTGGPPPAYTGGDPPQFTGGAPPSAPAAFSWDPTMAGLAATPGYQFTLQQAKQAQESSAAARGLGVSGAALRGAADYAGGLASSTYNQQLQNAINIYGTGLNQYDRQLAGYGQGINAYNAQLAGFGQGLNKYNAQLAGYGQGINSYNAQLAGFGQGLNQYNAQLAGFTQQAGAFQNQFSDYWANQTNPFNQLFDVSRLGANSAAQQSTSGTTAALNIGNAAQGQGQYQGAGIAQAGNALAGTIQSPAVQQLLTGSGSNANNQSVTGGGIFNSFSGLGPYMSGSGNYYNPGPSYSPSSYDPTFAPGAAPATQYYNPIGFTSA